MFATAIAVMIGLVSVHIAKRGRIEFVYGERHMLEHLAGVIGGLRSTFLFGNGIFDAMDKILRGTLNANDGEEAEGYRQKFARHIGAKSAAEAGANRVGKIFNGDMRMTMTFAGFHDLGIQNDGVGNLKNCRRQIGFRKFRAAASAEILNRFTLENIDVSFTAVKDHFLFYDGNALDFLRSAKAGADFCYDLHVHRNVDLIKTAVKGNAVNVNVCANDLRAFGAYTAASFDELVSNVGKINGNVLKAILVAAAIKNPMRVYIYRITGTAAKGRVVSGLGHNG